MAIENQTFDTVNNIQIPVTTIPWAGATGGAQAVTNRDPITGVGQTIDANGAAKVDGSGVTQPVSGSIAVTNFPATQAVSGDINVTALPALPPGDNAIGTVTVANPSGPGKNASGSAQFVPTADQSILINVGVNSSQTVIPGVAGKKIYVCAYTLLASEPSSGAGTVKFVDATASADLSGAMAVTPETGVSAGSGYGAILVVPAGDSLEITTALGASVQGHLAYTQC